MMLASWRKLAVMSSVTLSFLLFRDYVLLGNKTTYDEVFFEERLEPSTLITEFDFEKGLTFQCSLGELGNRMFFYAVVYGLSRLNNRSGYIQKCNINTCRWNDKDCKLDPLDQVFDITLPIGPNLPKEKQKGHKLHFHLTFPDDYRISPESNILTGEYYPCSVTHFLHVREEIRREFRFRKKFEDYARLYLKKARGLSRRKVTFVGVHVRRNSYLRHLGIFGKKVADHKFFNYSMTYFRNIVPNAMFIVLSDDLAWCQKNIVGDDVFIAESMGSGPQDLAVLSNCQHVIFDYGTYGLWGAFLAVGKVMYYINGIVDPTHKDSDHGKIMYPPEWTGVSDSMIDISLKNN